MIKPNYIAAVSDLWQAGTTEDGQPFIAEVWYVMVEFDNGARLSHNHKFYTTKQMIDEEDGIIYFPDLREEAHCAVDTLCAVVTSHINNGGALNPLYWTEMDPRYGSMAYQQLDQGGYFAVMEKKAEEF